MLKPKARSNNDFPVAFPGVYECPWRDESQQRVFVAIDRRGHCIAHSAGDCPSPCLMKRARAALRGFGRLETVRSAPAPVVARGVHLAPWRFHDDPVYVAVDGEGVCRAEAIGMDSQASAYLWAALGDTSGERTSRRINRARERRFQELYRSGQLESEIRRIRQSRSGAVA